jgi:hypothetical protein
MPRWNLPISSIRLDKRSSHHQASLMISRLMRIGGDPLVYEIQLERNQNRMPPSKPSTFRIG